MTDEIKDLTIVGGGLSGILMALKLSSLPQYKKKSITLIDEQPSLGGRLFFASSRSFLGKSRPQIYEELLLDSQSNKFLSGFGFEIFDLETKESLYRHIQNALTEDENLALDEWLAKFEKDSNISRLHNHYFVKKELTSTQSLLNGSSELLTKKESEVLKYFAINEFNTENEVKTIVHETIWKDLSKQSKEILSQIFESVIGLNWENVASSVCCKLLKSFFSLEKSPCFLAFKREVSIELFLEKILKNRGVEIRNLCRLARVERVENKSFSLILNDEIESTKKLTFTKQLVLCIPLSKCAGVLPKEFYSPEQSKFVSRVQPMSLVVYEISNFSSLKSSVVDVSLSYYDKFIFPVERAKAFYTSDDRMLFYIELDYENSLQAPAVRESVSKLKRAAARVLNEESGLEMKKGLRMPQTHFSERVILLPVAQVMPNFVKINFELKQIKMGVPHLFCCGDSLFSLADEPWKRVIHSVNDVAHCLV